MAKSKKSSEKLTPKQANWLRLFLDEENPSTFLNKSESARQAGYNCSDDSAYRKIGSENYTKLHKQIGKWLDEVGLSEARLKQKLLSLTEAKTTRFFSFQGKVVDMFEVDALDIQRQSLDMALKVKGLYAPEKSEIDQEIKIIVSKE